MFPPAFNFLLLTSVIIAHSFAQTLHESNINIRIEPGSQSCFFEKGRTGQMLELYYQVLDGQHGDLDISAGIIDPNGVKIVTDYKKSQNSIILDLEVDGDYTFCMDNTHSMMNSKLVYMSVLLEDKEATPEAEVAVIDNNGEELKEEHVLEWAGMDKEGKMYFIEVQHIAESLSRTLQHVVRARRSLDKYGASRSRDSYQAFEDTFIVDVWSGFQISFMCLVGILQVYMIKQLFKQSYNGLKNMY